MMEQVAKRVKREGTERERDTVPSEEDRCSGEQATFGAAAFLLRGRAENRAGPASSRAELFHVAPNDWGRGAVEDVDAAAVEGGSVEKEVCRASRGGSGRRKTPSGGGLE